MPSQSLHNPLTIPSQSRHNPPHNPFTIYSQSRIFTSLSPRWQGGQILRNCVSLSALLGRPVRVTKIRAGRKQPGMRAQHACGVELVRRLCNGQCDGCCLGSSELTFRPGGIVGGVGEEELATRADAGTAGSVLLLAQACLPVLAFAHSASRTRLIGGTDVAFSPPSDHFELTLRPLLTKMGLDCCLVTKRRGFYPRGGGECELIVRPSRRLLPISLVEQGRVKRFSGVAFACGAVPAKVAERMRQSAQRQLLAEWPDAKAEIRVAGACDFVGNGCGLTICAETDSGCVLGASRLGERGVPAERVAADAAEALASDLRLGACVDECTQDQLVLPMALAGGRSRILCRRLSEHTRTAMRVAELVAGARFRVDDSGDGGCVTLECDGIGLGTQSQAEEAA